MSAVAATEPAKHADGALVDGPFGYAISAEADRAVLELVSSEVYRQLGK